MFEMFKRWREERQALKMLKPTLLCRAVIDNPTGFDHVATKRSFLSDESVEYQRREAFKKAIAKAPYSATVVYDSRHSWFTCSYRTNDGVGVLVVYRYREGDGKWSSDTAKWLHFRTENGPESRAAIKLFNKNFRHIINPKKQMQNRIDSYQSSFTDD